MAVEPLRTAIILAHPIAASILIWAFYKQYGWVPKLGFTNREDREAAIRDHESMGNKVALAVLIVIVIAFISNVLRGLIDNNDPSSLLLPGFHGWTGLIGLAMMYVLWRLGRKTSEARDSGEKFASIKQSHEKLSDLVALLVAIHAFLGFLYLLSIL